MAASDRRAELEGWIASSRRLQIRMGIGLGVAALISLVIMIFDATVGKVGLAMLVITAICAYWVTGSHIADWRHQLEHLSKRKPGGSSS